MESLGITVIVIIGLIIALTFYFLPSLIAYNRGHVNRGVILVLNFLVGATGIGWIVLIVWALSNDNHIKNEAR